MTSADRARITSNEYFDLIIEYGGNLQLLEGFTDGVVQIMNQRTAIVYVPVAQLARGAGEFRFTEIPIPYGLTDGPSLGASGITNLRSQPLLDLRGNGTIVAIVDTGIDYQNPAFIREDGSSKIISIWDQTIESENYPFNTEFGTEYTREQINEALASPSPLDIVPSVDLIGHGTMMAAIAAGNANPEEDFYGVAPDAEIIIVKLRQAKSSIRNFFVISEEVQCFQENHIMWGIQYCQYKARELGQPIVISLGVGASMDAHDGRSPLANMCDIVGTIPSIAMVCGVGNEGNRGRHYFAIIDPSLGRHMVEMNVAEDEGGFSMVLWGDAPGLFSLDILSPSGEYIPRIPVGIRVRRVLSFIFEATVIYVDYQAVESQTGDQLIFLRFENISSGIWRFSIYGQGDLVAGFHMWLPMGDFISNDTYFIQPNIYTTVLSPADAFAPIAVTSYNPVNENLYVNAGRGYTRGGGIKPELAAPGVNYIAPGLNNTYTTYSGTSVSAAHTAGIAALIMEWGIVRRNRVGIDSISIKNFLIRGARRRSSLVYPNREWGYGIIDLYNAYNYMRISIDR